MMPRTKPYDRAFLETNLSLLDHPNAQVLPTRVPFIKQVFEEALVGKRSIDEPAICLLDGIRDHFAEEAARHGGEIFEKRYDITLRSVLRFSYESPFDIAKLNPPEEIFITNVEECAWDKLMGGLFSLDSRATLMNLLYIVGPMLNGSYILSENLIRLPASLRLVAGISHYLGRIDWAFQFMPDLYTPEQKVTLDEERLHGICLSPLPKDVDGHLSAHAYFAALHDMIAHSPSRREPEVRI